MQTFTTFKLNKGIEVLAREVDGIIKPFQYLSKAQAEKKAVAIGGGEVLRLTGAGAYYVVPKQ